jgi:peptidoglycan/LPS O-acetylase OafA/YrhL
MSIGGFHRGDESNEPLGQRLGMQRLHLSGLNGVRTIAAIAVVVSHTRLAMDRFGLPVMKSVDFADYGVTIFFALSGFLITYLLLLEGGKQAISIREFYIRRVLRIWPLYYSYLLLAVLTAYFLTPWQIPSSQSLLFYFLLMANVPFVRDLSFPRLEHFWSLGVEEQFYLVWPLIIKFVRSPFRLIFGFIVFYVTLKALLRLLGGPENIFYEFMAATRFDCMAIGGVGAFVYHRQSEPWLTILSGKWIQVVSWGLLGLTLLKSYHVPLLGHDLVACATVCIIFAQISRKNRIISLDNELFESLGRLTYGIYVIHPLVIFYLSFILKPVSMSANVKISLIFFCVIIATVLMAALSYRWLERPFLRIKERFSKVHAWS